MGLNSNDKPVFITFWLCFAITIIAIVAAVWSTHYQETELKKICAEHGLDWDPKESSCQAK